VRVVDENVSGGRAVADRDLEKLIERAEAGLSDGVIVYRTNRFGRDHVENLVAVKRLKEAGARLVGTNDGVDSDQPQGKWRPCGSPRRTSSPAPSKC
jgi:site-specific DNA recombinase